MGGTKRIGPEKTEDIYRAAEMHCNNRTDKEIATVLGVSGTEVQRMLRTACNLRIIKFDPPPTDWGYKLKDKFNLTRAIVVFTSEDYAVTRRLRGEAIARYLDKEVGDGRESLKVAVSGGETLFEAAQSFPSRPRLLAFYPAAIMASGPDLNHLDPLVLVSFFWARSGGLPPNSLGKSWRDGATAHFITVPHWLPSSREHNGTALKGLAAHSKNLVANPHVARVWERARQADIVLTSCAPLLPPMEYVSANHVTASDLLDAHYHISRAWLADNQGIVGDVNYSFFHDDGTPLAPQPFLALDMQCLQQKVRDGKSVLLTAGMFELEQARILLEKRAANVFVTDEATAHALIAHGKPDVK